MRINTNIAALNAQRQLGITENRVAQSMAKLSSGFRINRAADDAAGLGIANKLRADIRSMTQASRNAEQANSLLQIAEGASSGIQSMLERIKELATQANSDTVDANGSARIDAEYQELLKEIDRTVSTTQFQGKKLLDGSFTGQFMISSSGQYGTVDADLLEIDGTTTLKLDTTTLTLNGTDLTSKTNAQGVLTAVDTAINNVNAALGAIGAYQNRIENAQANIKTAIQNYSASESVIRDLDMAEEMTTFTKNQILAQAGTAMLAQANQSSQGILQLLRG